MGNEDSHGLVCLIFDPDYLQALQNLYQLSIVGPDDVDESKYLISKKLSEVPFATDTHIGDRLSDGGDRWFLMLQDAWKMIDSSETLCTAWTSHPSSIL